MKYDTLISIFEKNDMFKPASSADTAQRKKEYQDVVAQRIYDRFNGGKPFAVGDYIRIDFLLGSGPTYYRVEKLYKDNEGIIRLETTPIYCHHSYWTSGNPYIQFIRGIQTLSSFDNYHKNEVLIMTKDEAEKEIAEYKAKADAEFNKN